MRRNSLFAFVLVLVLLVTSVATATDLVSAAGHTFDISDGLAGTFSTDGSMQDGTIDEYDGCYYLTVGDVQYTGAPGATTSLGGRQVDLPEAPVGAGLTASRHAFVPASGPSYVRYVDVISNPGGSEVTTTITISGNLGSDSSTRLSATSSGDLTIGTDDSWFASWDGGPFDLPLAHVFQGAGGLVTASMIAPTGGMMPFGGSDTLSYSFVVTVPGGGRVAILHFAVEESTTDLAAATAAYLAELPDDALMGIDEYLGDVVNWPVASSGVCMGAAEGAACSSTRGAAGSCHAGRCCTGCWDGAVCRSGRTTATCGIAGGACTRCVAVSFCESDMCTAGVCGGSPCDDGETCTTDSCDEALDRCNHVVTSGCIVGGECVTEGAHHIAYPCLVCDSSRNPVDWSPVAMGASCGSDRCSTGRLFHGGTCDGAGECIAPRVEVCETMACAGAACAPPCTATSCRPGERCGSMRRCEALRGLGDACMTADQCMSGVCADGVCCSAGCDGVCYACALPGSEGSCTAIPSGTDPYAECAGARVCNGAGACAAAGEDAGRDAARAADAGDTGARDAGPRPDAGTMDAGAPVEEPRGCACTAAGAGGGSHGAWFALVLASLFWRRRR